MDTLRKRQIIVELAAYMAARDLNQAEVSRTIGVSEEYLSEMLKPDSEFKYNAGKTTGDIPVKWFRMIEDWLGIAPGDNLWKTVPTIQMKQIIAHMEDARNYGYTRVIVGETGCGKTFVADKFVKEFPKDTFKITVGSTDTINDLLVKVIDTLKLTSDGTKSAKIRRIIERLQKMRNEGMHPVIIFDEAEYMKQATLCSIKELHDALNKVCGIVLIGTHQIVTKLNKLRTKDREGIPQFYRRVKFGTKHLNGIDTRFKDFLNAITDKGLVTFLQQHCDNYGELHDVLVPAMREAQRTGEPLTENFVRMVLGMPGN